MEKLHFAITTTSMGNGHIMKAISISRAFERIRPVLKEKNIEFDARIIDERISLSPATRMLKGFIESLYNFVSSSRYIKIWWDKRVMVPESGPVEKTEAIVRFINRATGGKMVRPSRDRKYDAIVSTHPSDRIARFPEGTVFLRVNPDIFCHAFHMIPISGMEEWHILADEKLRQRIFSGKERSLPKRFIPASKERVLALGAFVHPENIDSLDDGSYGRLFLSKKMPVMFQIGGAGAQQEVFLEIMRILDYKLISPLFAAGGNMRFYRRLLEEGHRLGKITDQEFRHAKSRDFTKLDYHKSIINFSSGLRILFNVDRHTGVEDLDTAKSKNLINVVKPGDVTSAGSVMYFLYHIGGHEIENANWAIGHNIGRWLVKPEEYEDMRMKMKLPDLDRKFGAVAAEAVYDAYWDKKELAEQADNLCRINYLGSYNIASLCILISVWKKNKDKSMVYSVYGTLAKYRFCNFKRSILNEVMKK